MRRSRRTAGNARATGLTAALAALAGGVVALAWLMSPPGLAAAAPIPPGMPMPRIVGGDAVQDFSKYSFTVALVIAGTRLCGATLVANNVLLTAAHCVCNETPTQCYNSGMPSITAYVGNKDYTQGVPIAASDWKVHPNWDRDTLVNDMAALRLSENAVAASGGAAQPTAFSRDGDVPPSGQVVTALGWGRTCDTCPTVTELRKVDLDVISNPSCAVEWQRVIQPSQVCLQTPNKDQCNGDSGGPVVNATKALVAMTSWGSSTCSGKPSVNTRIGSFTPFIDDAVNEWRMTPTPTPGGGGGGGGIACFSAQSMVEVERTASGEAERVTMRDLRLGDRVRVDGRGAFSEVIAWLHRDEHARADFIALHYTGAGNRTRRLLVTPHHLLMRHDGNGGAQYASAAEFIDAGGARPQPVTSKRVRRLPGVYAPLTRAGTIVVDGVRASCYAHVPSHALAHAAMAPLRWMRWMRPPAANAGDAAASRCCSGVDNGQSQQHGYVAALQAAYFALPHRSALQ